MPELQPDPLIDERYYRLDLALTRSDQRMTARFSVLTVLRVLVIAMLLLYAASIYLEMNLTISPEARQYQADYPEAIRNGFSLMGGLLKLFALVGTIAGSVGAALLLLGSTRALPYIIFGGTVDSCRCLPECAAIDLPKC